MRERGFFFFNDTATTEIYTLSLHDALPICVRGYPAELKLGAPLENGVQLLHELEVLDGPGLAFPAADRKSTRPELQSRQYLVCRLLLEKKKTSLISPSYTDPRLSFQYLFLL